MRYYPGRRVWGDAMWPTCFQRRNFRPELKYFNFEAVISQLGQSALEFALVALEAEVFQA